MIEVIKDQLNVIELVDLQCSMQAIEDKIIILVDDYKSGYECKKCGGSGKIKSTVVIGSDRDCDECNGKGSILVIPDTAKSLPSTGVVMSMGPETKYMQLKWNVDQTRKKLSMLPWASDEYQRLENILIEQENIMKQCSIQIGTRVVFGVHVGTKVPIKGNIRLTIMREREPLCIVFGSSLDEKSLIDYSAEPTY